VLTEGRNCWRRARAHRVAMLVDGQAYFDAFATAVERARRSIVILAWDIHSRVRLRRDGGRNGLPDELGEFLNAVVSRNPDLHVNVLDWDFAMIYALEREPLPLFNLGWRTHRRLHFRLDDDHPPGASHHQKIVVVDDALAFVGGLDIAACRWDTARHLAHDPRRVDPGYPLYAPFHDVQMVFDGPAAAAVAALARERWRRATGKPLPARRVASDPWPPGLAPELRDVDVAIARTEPAWEGRPPVHEVENLYLDAIGAARRSIYVEAQYLSSARIGDALAARLQESAGPEVVIVAQCACAGWLEESTMGTLRARLLAELRAADHHHRLGVYYPVVPDLDGQNVVVHSKVFVVDDCFLRVGSSNLTNRSMRLDTECDVAIEAEDADGRAAIAGVRDRLLGEHLGVEPGQVAARIADGGSLLGAIESLRGTARTLAPLETDGTTSWPQMLAPPIAALADPERPVDVESLTKAMLSDEVSASAAETVLYAAGVVAILALGIALWWWTPLGDLAARLVRVVKPLVHVPAGAALLVVAGFVVGGALLVPVTALVFVTGLIFGALPGSIYAVVGCLGSAAIGYGLGRALSRDMVRLLAGPRLNRVSRGLTHRGARAIARLRLVPTAPFAIVNLVAGASHVPLRDLLGGTFIALAPFALALTLLADCFWRLVRTPSPFSAVVLVLATALVVATGRTMRRALGVTRG
jgi:phosphatidylserine/phosphatidylglycerophosphate/cardiolipin synthase-like enzyme/uncharacterized membrane protein YdjX (TVP38/TMEM64 family)